jgi:hypothetical protein
MKILFLDIDGVLNNPGCYAVASGSHAPVEPSCVKALNYAANENAIAAGINPRIDDRVSYPNGAVCKVSGAIIPPGEYEVIGGWQSPSLPDVYTMKLRLIP